MTSWWVLVQETVDFWIYFWILNISKLGQIIDISKGNSFQESLDFGANFQVLFNLATWSNYLITNNVKIAVFHFFEKVNKEKLKMVNVNY